MNKKKTLRFYITLWIAKLSSVALKILRRNATYFPGKIALTLCPEFMGIIEKPKTIIGVTGTNGKTTTCNMINSILEQNGFEFINNKYGSNIDGGIATTLIQGVNFLGKSKKDLAVLEIDERSSNKIFPYLTPTYLVCTNLFRDSLMRNAHTEFISEILNKYIPKETIMIENADDIICSHIAEGNRKIYFSIDKLETDTKECENITRDIRVCPKCLSKLEYEYVRYHHIGKAYCPNCDYKCPENPDYRITNIDLKNMQIKVKSKNEEETYDIVNDNIINIYNMLAVIAVLKELKLTAKQINDSFAKIKIVETRYSEEIYKNYKIVTQLAKGMNPIACSIAFNYIRKEPANKAVIMILDDLHEEANGSENTAWQYDVDYEFLNDESIKQIIIAGPRYLDSYIRCLIADINPEKMVYEKDLIDATGKLKLEGIEKIFILHDLYSIEETKQIKQKVKEIIDEKIPEEK